MGKEADDEVELAYWRMREAELKKEVEEIGNSLGVEFTDTIVSEHLAHVIDMLEVTGNDALAPRYAEAFARATAATALLRCATEAGQPDGEERDATNDAVEQFERVEAEVLAWFDGLKK